MKKTNEFEERNTSRCSSTTLTLSCCEGEPHVAALYRLNKLALRGGEWKLQQFNILYPKVSKVCKTLFLSQVRIGRIGTQKKCDSSASLKGEWRSAHGSVSLSLVGLPEERACFPNGSERRLLGQRLPRGLQEEHRAPSPQPAGDRRPEQRDGPELLDRQVRRHLQGRRGHAASATTSAPERRVGAHPQ